MYTIAQVFVCVCISPACMHPSHGYPGALYSLFIKNK